MKQLLTFFGFAYLISWIVWFPLYAPIFGMPNLYKLPFQHALGGLGPMLASFITTWIFLKIDGVRAIARKSLQVKPLLYAAIALLSPFLLAILSSVISHFIYSTPVLISELLTTKESPGFNLPTFFLYNLFFFGFGEEVGWRGFALPRFLAKLPVLKASFILTLLWAMWHLPLFLYRPGYTAMSLASLVGWLFSLLTGSILLTWLYNSSKGSILICAIFHSTIDIAFTTDFANKNTVNIMGALITVWGIVTVVILKSKRPAINLFQLSKNG